MDIAIIGMSGRFSDAKNIMEFYRNLKMGKDCVREFSKKRLKNTGLPLSEDYELFGFLEDIDLFDHEFFNISLSEAQNMDPHQRIIMEVVYETFENAGYNPDDFNNSNTAVFIGDVKLEYEKLSEHFDPTLPIGSLNSITAGRISRYFNLRGTSLMVDTACSSSLVAVHLASNELKLGEADFALVCGVNMKLIPGRKNNQNDIGISSPDGKTRSFSSEANGTGSGEAVACILLKPLDRALKDKDYIHAILKGSAVNQDAALSGSLTAPSSVAQAEVIKKAWKKADIDPRTIAYIEAHGTGTKLGDPIEVQGIDLAFKGFTTEKQFCALSTVKSNMGHANTSAGLCGLIKAILSLKYQELFPSLHFSQPNPFIDFKNSSVYVNTELREWKSKGIPRRAGVSSFGISGTNCHVIVEENTKTTEKVLNEYKENVFYPIIISAKNTHSLKANINALSAFLKLNPDINLENISYTLAIGRKHFAYRFATLANSVSDLVTALDRYPESVKSAKNMDKIILVFSDSSLFSENDLIILALKYPIFLKALTYCKQFVSPTEQSPNFYSFCFQYCFYQLSESKGVIGKIFLGEGIGEWVIEALTGKVPVEVAIKKVLEPGFGKVDDLRTRCISLLARLEGQKIVFAEIGYKGNLVNMLEELNPHDSTFEFVRLKESPDVLQEFVKDIFLVNGLVNWNLFYKDYSPSRLELPSYQFNRKRCWIKEVEKLSVENSIYNLTWSKSKRNEIMNISGKTFLIFMDNWGLGEGLVNSLKTFNRCIKVYNSESFEIISHDYYKIPFNNFESYLKLYERLNECQDQLTDIIHLGGCKNLEYKSQSNLEDKLQTGLYEYFYLAKAFDRLFEIKNICVTLVTGNSRKVFNEEHIIYPEYSTSHGFINCLREEYPLLKVKAIDIDPIYEAKDNVINQLINELGIIDEKIGVCYRKDSRYIPKFQKIDLLEQNRESKNFPNEKKTYVITGGASGIGLAIARYLSLNQNHLNLILLNRRCLPHESQWEAISKDPAHLNHEEIKTFEDIRSNGSVLRYYSVDIANPIQLEGVLKQIRDQFGQISGVIHAAGVLKAQLIKDQSYEAFKEGISAKIYGTVNLHQLIPEKLDFFFMFSSYDTVIGREKYSSYSAANIFQDNYAEELRQKGIKSITIKWPDWEETGINFRLSKVSSDHYNYENSISTEEGLNAFNYIFEARNVITSNVTVSVRNPNLYDINPYFLTNQDEDLSQEIVEAKPQNIVPSEQCKSEDKQLLSKHPTWNETEYKVAQIWREVLKVDDLKLEDDFFDLGGHSLNGTQVLNKVEKDFGVKLNFDNLFDYPTLREFAGFIGEHFIDKKEIDEENKIRQIEKQEYYEATHIQKRLWLIQKFDPQQCAYNMPSAYHFFSDLNIYAFESALKALVHRHESLRTSFIEVEGSLKQKIWEIEGFSYALECRDLSKIANTEESLTKLINNEAIAPFDLEKGPLVKTILFKLEDQSYIFFFSLHHIIADGWSLEVIINEVMTLYDQFCKGNQDPLLPLKLQFKDYTAWTNNNLKGNKLKEHKEYWLQQFNMRPPMLFLPLDFERPLKKTYMANKVWLTLDSEMSHSLRTMANRNNATIFMTLTALLNLLLLKHTRQTDITIGSPVSSRNHPDLENQIGIYLNTIAIRTRFDVNDNFIELLKKVKQKIIEAYSHQLYPFDLLIQDLDFDHANGRSLLFDVGFTFSTQNSLKSFEVEEAENTIKASPINHNFNSVKADLWIHVNESEKEIKLGIDYNIELFKKSTIERMMLDFKHLAQKTVENPLNSLETFVELANKNQIRENRIKQKEIKERNLAFLKNS